MPLIEAARACRSFWELVAFEELELLFALIWPARASRAFWERVAFEEIELSFALILSDNW